MLWVVEGHFAVTGTGSSDATQRIREAVVPHGAVDAVARDDAAHRLQQQVPRGREVDAPRLQRHPSLVL